MYRGDALSPDVRTLATEALAVTVGNPAAEAVPADVGEATINSSCVNVATTPETIPPEFGEATVNRSCVNVATTPEARPAEFGEAAVSTWLDDVASTPEAIPAELGEAAEITWLDDAALGDAIDGVTGVVVGVIARTTEYVLSPTANNARAMAAPAAAR